MENAFLHFNPGDHGANGCTPTVSDDFIGIKINGPDNITLPRWTKSGAERRMILPLCGIYRFGFDFVVKLGSPEEHMSIIVINNETHKSYAGRILSGDPILENPNVVPKHIEPEQESFETGYFDINLLEYVSFPLAPGDYQVYVVLEEHKSNVINIKVKMEK